MINIAGSVDRNTGHT